MTLANHIFERSTYIFPAKRGILVQLDALQVHEKLLAIWREGKNQRQKANRSRKMRWNGKETTSLSRSISCPSVCLHVSAHVYENMMQSGLEYNHKNKVCFLGDDPKSTLQLQTSMFLVQGKTRRRGSLEKLTPQVCQPKVLLLPHSLMRHDLIEYLLANGVRLQKKNRSAQKWCDHLHHRRQGQDWSVSACGFVTGMKKWSSRVVKNNLQKREDQHCCMAPNYWSHVRKGGSCHYK